ncbi:MAG: C40 family peptidase [Bacteroidales bacterium]|nr:C40 family peptidase [Bacteroidales bacterium]
MSYGVCILSVVPLRAEASERAEMVSQLLFGDSYEVLEVEGNWLKIKTSDCGYEGFLNQKYHHELTDTQYQELQHQPQFLVSDFMTLLCEEKSQTLFPVFIGTSFPQPNEEGHFNLGDAVFTLPSVSSISDTNSQFTIHNSQFTICQLSTVNCNLTPDPCPLTPMLSFALRFLRTPYLWGGRTPAGIDCSGFTQLIYKSIGVLIPRDASQQVELGSALDFASEAQIGDLAFFQNEEGRIVHVGMVCAPGKIIHASGQVRIDKLDDTGIFNADKGQYSHHLRIIKRIL